MYKWPRNCPTILFQNVADMVLFQNVADSATSYIFYLIYARVAQSVEHWSNKPTVAGSIPVVSIYDFAQHDLFS